MNDKEWLQNLKVGDKVIIAGNYGNKAIKIVSNVTPKQIVIEVNRFKDNDGKEQIVNSRYWKKDGFLVCGDMFVSDMLREATPEAMIKFEEERYRAVFRNKLDHLSWADVPLDRIKEIREIIEPYVKRKES